MPVMSLVPVKSILLLVVALFLSASLSAANDGNELRGSRSQERVQFVLIQESSAAEIDEDAASAGDENSSHIVDTSHQQDQSMAAWLEQTIRPVTQWITRLRRLPVDEKSSLHIKSNEQSRAGQWSGGMNQAVAVVQQYYDGVVLSVRRLKAEEETYRIKLLRRSGELQAVDYNKTRDQFISANRGGQDADSVD